MVRPTLTACTTSCSPLSPKYPSVAAGCTFQMPRRSWMPCSAAGSSTRTRSSRAGCRSTSPIRTRAQIAIPVPTVRISSAIPKVRKNRDQWFNTIPIGSSGSAFGRPARGTFGDLPRYYLRGPGTGASTRRSSSTSPRLGSRHRAATGSRQPVQPREPGEPGFRDRRAGECEHERRADHVDGVR